MGMHWDRVRFSRHSWAASLFVVPRACGTSIPDGPQAVATDDTPRRRLGCLRELSERLQNLLIVEDRSPRGFLYFELRAYLLNLRGLLFETRNDTPHLFL